MSTPKDPAAAALVESLRREVRRLREHAQTAWQRGHQMGLIANERTAREAIAALQREREAHADTNSRLTESLMQAEAEIEIAYRRGLEDGRTEMSARNASDDNFAPTAAHAGNAE